MSLHNLQNDFKNTILGKEKNAPILNTAKTPDLDSRIAENDSPTLLLTKQKSILDSYIAENGLTTKQRVQIYRNNIVITLTEALHSIYPTIHQLVGNEFFTGVAHKYIAQHLPTSGDLHDYGHRFAEFLADFPPAQSLPYLPEVARLEWAYHEVFHAAESTFFDLNRLKEIPEQNYGNIQFKLHPSSRLLDFQFPILRIWQMCQNASNDEENINLDESGEKVLVIRRQMEITFEKVSAGEFALLSAFNNGAKFEEACAVALQAESAFKINSALEEHLLKGTVVSFIE